MKIGTYLMEQLIADADRRQMHIYLETNIPTQLNWFKKLGFEISSEHEPVWENTLFVNPISNTFLDSTRPRTPLKYQFIQKT